MKWDSGTDVFQAHVSGTNDFAQGKKTGGSVFQGAVCQTPIKKLILCVASKKVPSRIRHVVCAEAFDKQIGKRLIVQDHGADHVDAEFGSMQISDGLS